MKSIKVNLSKNLAYMDVHPFADWHIGDMSCNKQNILNSIDIVKNDPNAYAILNGDLINNATKASISDCYAEEFPPMEAVNYLISILEPIQSKILLITQGNHEARTYRSDGIDLSFMIANKLNIADRYCREGGVLLLKFGQDSETNKKQQYSFYITHGSGGGRKVGSKANRLLDMAGIVDVDIYVHSHTHTPMIIRDAYHHSPNSNGSTSKNEKLFVNTCAQLEYGGYGQTYEYEPSSTINPIIYLNGTKKQYYAKL